VSVQVFLEADYRLTKPGVMALLLKMGAEIADDDDLTDPDDLEVRALLPRSSMSIHGKSQRNPRICAEEPGDAKFEVAYRCAFTVNSSEHCMSDIDKFAEGVANETGAAFVVSWQFERTLITNSMSGLRRIPIE
jgi:hypothetical protein